MCLPLQSTIGEYTIEKVKNANDDKHAPKYIYISRLIRIVKSTIMIPTVLCIFAVDFHDFPRRFCKTEAFGISLMDVGTGCVIIGSGMASNIAKFKSSSVLSRFMTNIKGIPVIMAIAIGGILSRWIVNHPEIVTEYGVHWNFFWTIAFITLATSFVSNINIVNYFGLGLYAIYQF
jgi:glucosaminylphosphatidylinositol acyltransferase